MVSTNECKISISRYICIIEKTEIRTKISQQMMLLLLWVHILGNGFSSGNEIILLPRNIDGTEYTRNIQKCDY